MLRIGPATFHVFDLGHFLWARPATQDEPIPARSRLVPGGGASAWWMNVLVLSVLYWLQGLRAGWMGVQNLHALWQIALAIAVVLGVRSLAMKVVGRLIGLEARYRMWETGLTLSVIVAVLGGLFLPPGSHYPRTVRWSYRSELPRLGPVAFAGSLAVLVLGWLLYALYAVGGFGVTDLVHGTLERAMQAARILLLFDVLLPFFPFGSFNGRRVLDYSRVLWVLLAAGVIALIVSP